MTDMPPPYEPSAYEPPANEPLAAPGRGRGPSGGLVLAFVLAVAVVVGAGSLFVFGAVNEKSFTSYSGALCQPMRDVPVPADATGHREGTIEYDSAPPAGGPHNGVPLPAVLQVIRRDAAPDLVAERAVHNLEHGYVVVWYDTDATDDQVDAVAESVRAAFLRKVMVVPWTHGTFDGPSFVLSAWGHLQACEQPDTADVKAFWVAHGGENGEAPEASAP